MQFVTAFYTGLEGTRYNGNSAGIFDRYKLSLLGLVKSGYDITCFISEHSYNLIKEDFKDYNNIKFIIYELSKYPHHNKIEQIKDINSKYASEMSWKSRCVEIMWGKFNWLDIVSKDLSDDDYLFWIDVGLFHGGLISNDFRSPKSESFYDFDIITKERNLYNDLVDYSDGKIINIKSESVNHGSEDYVKVFDNVRPEYGIVGGIFGGKLSELKWYINRFTSLVEEVLNHNILLKEEEIMYYISKTDYDRFKIFEFNSWYHSEWGAEYATKTSFSDFFKVIHVK